MQEYLYNGANPLTPRPGVLTLQVPANLTRRRLYAYTFYDVVDSTKDYGAWLSVEMFSNGTSVGKLPLNSGKAIEWPTSSISWASVSACIYNPASIADNLLRIDFASPQASSLETGGSGTCFLAPFEFTAAIDTIKVNYDREVNVICFWRIILAMASTL